METRKIEAADELADEKLDNVTGGRRSTVRNCPDCGSQNQDVSDDGSVWCAGCGAWIGRLW